MTAHRSRWLHMLLAFVRHGTATGTVQRDQTRTVAAEDDRAWDRREHGNVARSADAELLKRLNGHMSMYGFYDLD